MGVSRLLKYQKKAELKTQALQEALNHIQELADEKGYTAQAVLQSFNPVAEWHDFKLLHGITDNKTVCIATYKAIIRLSSNQTKTLKKLEKQFLQQLKKEQFLGKKLQNTWKQYEAHLKHAVLQDKTALKKMQALLACPMPPIPLHKQGLRELLSAVKKNRVVLIAHRANSRWKRFWAALYRGLKLLKALFIKKPNKKETFFKTTGHTWCDTIEHLAARALLWDKKESLAQPTTNPDLPQKSKIFSPTSRNS